jgi:hypothetical protein
LVDGEDAKKWLSDAESRLKDDEDWQSVRNELIECDFITIEPQ